MTVMASIGEGALALMVLPALLDEEEAPPAFEAAPPAREAARDSVEMICVGAHTLCLEPSDIFVLTLNGGVLASEMSTLVDEINRLSEGKTQVFGITDLTHLRSVSTEARMHLLRLSALPRGIAYVGVKLQMRIGFSTVNSLRSKLHHEAVDTPITFVKTEEEARAWVHSRRRELEAESGIRSKAAFPADPGE